jgi:hypothetical protein
MGLSQKSGLFFAQMRFFGGVATVTTKKSVRCLA